MNDTLANSEKITLLPEALRGGMESKFEFEAILRSLNNTVIVSITDAKGTIEYVNDMFVKTSKYPREELIGQNHRILKSGFHPPEVYADLWATISSGNPWRGEIKNRAKDGSYYWVDANIAPIYGLDGSIKKYIAIRFLITDRKRAEEESAHQVTKLEDTRHAMLNLLEDIEKERKISESTAIDLQKFQLAVEHVSQHIIITDADGIILYANPAVERVTGYSRAEIIGNKPSLWGRQMPQEFYTALWHTIKDEKKTFVGELKNKKKNGKIYAAHSTISPVVGADGEVKFFIGLEVDVTEQLALEAARMSFISIASHQLRTPLTSMRWSSEMLMDGDAGEITAGQRNLIENIYSGTMRMTSLVNLLLQISRVEAGRLKIEPTPIDFKNVIQGVTSSLKSFLDAKSQHVEIRAVPDPFPVIPMDQEVIWQVFQNLISNASRYGPEKKPIIISMTVQGANAKCAVTDTGIGIPKDQQHRIFEKFFRAENALRLVPEGSGLGLALVKALVEGWHGEVWFESAENEGSTFYFTIPLAGEDAKEGEVSLKV